MERVGYREKFGGAINLTAHAFGKGYINKIYNIHFTILAFKLATK